MTCLSVVLTFGRLDSNTFVLQCYVQLDLSIQVTQTSEAIVANYKLIDIVSPLIGIRQRGNKACHRDWQADGITHLSKIGVSWSLPRTEPEGSFQQSARIQLRYGKLLA
jgi:hypothetical protein